MTLKASGKTWIAVKIVALGSLIAASCALPAYELGDGRGSSSATSGGGDPTGASSSGSTSSSTSSSGEADGGVNSDSGPGPDAGGCPDPTASKEPAPGDPCDLPDNTICPISRPCCDVKMKCILGHWEVPPPGCPDGCPTYPLKATCTCAEAALKHACFYDFQCSMGANGKVKMLTCPGDVMTLTAIPCCDANNGCADGMSTCVHLPANPGLPPFNLCVPTKCAAPIECACVDQMGMCVTDGFVCELVDPAGGVYCKPFP